MFEKLRLDPRLSEFTNEQLRDHLLKIYSEREQPVGRLYNNVTNKNEVMSLEQFVNAYLNGKNILSGYACLYKDQHTSTNISSAALANLGDMRKFNKNKMEAAEHGSDEYIYYRVLQLTYKVLMNSYYGILGEKNSVFYNPFVQNSITQTGQDLITTAIVGMESFLSNNTPFEDTDDCITFINNILNTEHKHPVLDYLDEPKSTDEVVDYLVSHSVNPEKMNRGLITSIIKNLSLEDANRVYYCNQVQELLKHSWFISSMKNMLMFSYTNKPEEGMLPFLNEFKSVVLDICWYDWLFEERYKKAVNYKRQTIIACDTDSVFININKYIEQVFEELGLDVDDEKNTETKNTLVNIFINLTTDALKQLFITLTTNMGLVDEAKPIINMKQEFLYDTILLTTNKKNYGGLITAELGKRLSKPVLDIKGKDLLFFKIL